MYTSIFPLILTLLGSMLKGMEPTVVCGRALV